MLLLPIEAQWTGGESPETCLRNKSVLVFLQDISVLQKNGNGKQKSRLEQYICGHVIAAQTGEEGTRKAIGLIF